MESIFGNSTPVESPFSGLGDVLKAAAQRKEAAKAMAAKNLLAQQELAQHQQKLDMEQQQHAQHMAMETQKFQQATEDRQLQKQQAGHAAIAPLIDPNSPDFNPEEAKRIGAMHGINIQAMPQGPAPIAPGPGPQEPQPGFVGPLQTPEDASLNAREAMLTHGEGPPSSGDVTPNLGSATVDQTGEVESGPNAGYHRADISFPDGGDTVNIPAGRGGLHEGQQLPIEGPVDEPSPSGAPTDVKAVESAGQKAFREAQQQEQERSKYAQDLASFPERTAKHTADVQNFQAQRQEYQARGQMPTLQIQGPGMAPQTVDTRGMFRQMAGQHENRAARASAMFQDDPEMAKVAGQMASLGATDAQIMEAITKQQNSRLAPGIRAQTAGAGLEEKKREFDYSALSAAEKLQVAAMKKKGGGAGGAGKATVHEFQEQSKQLRNVVGSARSPGALDMMRRIEGVHGSLDHAIKSGDQEQITAATTAAVEQAGALLRGGVTTGISVQLLEKMQSMADELKSQWGRFTGDPGYQKEFAHRVQTVMSTVWREQAHRLDAAKESYQNMTMAPGSGSAVSPELKRLAMSNLSVLSSVPLELGSQQRRYSEHGTPAAPAKPATPAATGHPAELPVGATKQLPNGTTVRKVGPNNWQPVTQ